MKTARFLMAALFGLISMFCMVNAYGQKTAKDFPVWHTITCGGDGKILKDQLIAQDLVDTHNEDLMWVLSNPDLVDPQEKGYKYDLFLVTTDDLGSANLVDSIMNRARALDFDLLEPWMLFQLYLETGGKLDGIVTDDGHSLSDVAYGIGFPVGGYLSKIEQDINTGTTTLKVEHVLRFTESRTGVYNYYYLQIGAWNEKMILVLPHDPYRSEQ